MFYTRYTDPEYRGLQFRVWSIFKFWLYLLQKNYLLLILITLCTSIPTNFIAEYTISNHLIPIREGLSGIKDIGNIYKLSGIFFGLVGYLASFLVIRNFLLGKETTLSDALVYGVKNWYILIGTSILYFLIVLLGMLALIIPGIILAIWFGFYVYAIWLEEIPFRKALTYSKSLIYGRWWRSLWTMFLFWLLTLVLLIIPTGLLGAAMWWIAGDLGIFSLDVMSDVVLDILSIPGQYVPVWLFLAFQKFPPTPVVLTAWQNTTL